MKLVYIAGAYRPCLPVFGTIEELIEYAKR